MKKLLVVNQDYEKVVAKVEINANDIVHHICCKEFKVPTSHTVTLDIGYHVEDELASKINHSFFPNVYIKGDSIISLKNIKVGEEIKRNYYDTNEIILEPFTDRETGELINTKGLYLYKNADVFDEYDQEEIEIEFEF